MFDRMDNKNDEDNKNDDDVGAGASSPQAERGNEQQQTPTSTSIDGCLSADKGRLGISCDRDGSVGVSPIAFSEVAALSDALAEGIADAQSPGESAIKKIDEHPFIGAAADINHGASWQQSEGGTTTRNDRLFDDVKGEGWDEAASFEGGNFGPLIQTPDEKDILCGRGAAINAREMNKRLRALCFSRKPEFDVANIAAKRRLAVEIVRVATGDWGSRFLKRSKDNKGPWTEMTTEQAVAKVSQIMRDYKRPDRVAQLEAQAAANPGKTKKQRSSATPMEGVMVPEGPLPPIVENPFGVNDHDVICGRGAYSNSHVGNQTLRCLAVERKAQFDRGTYTEKRGLATEIVTIIRSLNPPGRFLQRVTFPNNHLPTPGESDSGTAENGSSFVQGCGYMWEDIPDEKAIHKACQVMRDIDRPDRKYRELRRKERKTAKDQKFAAFRAAAAVSHDTAASATAPSSLDGNPSTPFTSVTDSVSVETNHGEASLLTSQQASGAENPAQAGTQSLVLEAAHLSSGDVMDQELEGAPHKLTSHSKEIDDMMST